MEVFAGTKNQRMNSPVVSLLHDSDVSKLQQRKPQKGSMLP